MRTTLIYVRNEHIMHMAFVVLLKVFHPSPYTKLSQEFKHDHITFYCNDYFDMIVVKGQVTEEMLDQIRVLFQIDSPLVHSTYQVDHINYIIINCQCKKSSQITINQIIKNQGVQLSPVMYLDGWEHHNFLCITKANVGQIIDDLQEKFKTEIISIREHGYYNPLEFFGITPNKMYEELSDNQMEMLIEAYRRGYYKIPRDITLATIAESHGKSRHAVERAIRKAENKIMHMVVPLVDFEIKHQNLLATGN